MTYSAKAPDYIANEQLRARIAELEGVVNKYETRDREAEEQAQLARLKEQEELEESVHRDIENARRKLDEARIPRPETLAAYSRLPIEIKTRMIDAFSLDFLDELVQKERAGVDWATWDKLKATQSQ